MREWVRDKDVSQQQVNAVTKLGFSRKYGGAGNRKRFRSGVPMYAQLENALLEYFDTRANDNLSISRKLLGKQAKRIAERHGLQNFKASKGYIHKFLWRMEWYPKQ